MKVRDWYGHSKTGAEVRWHVGLGLGTHTMSTSTDHSEATIYAPRGHLLALEVPQHDSGCQSLLQVFEVDQEIDQKVTLICE